jgi:hypothetical protein
MAPQIAAADRTRTLFEFAPIALQCLPAQLTWSDYCSIEAHRAPGRKQITAHLIFASMALSDGIANLGWVRYFWLAYQRLGWCGGSAVSSLSAAGERKLMPKFLSTVVCLILFGFGATPASAQWRFDRRVDPILCRWNEICDYGGRAIRGRGYRYGHRGRHLRAIHGPVLRRRG